METKNYTLEKHLESICEVDKDYNVLLATWRLNKENLTLALNTIAADFPHYSLHDASHSSKVLDNIQRLLGKDRIERLGATDTFLLLMSAMTHDLGMYLYYKILEEQWDNEKMESLLKDYAQSDDKTIAKAAHLLLHFKRCPSDPVENYKWALDVRNAVTIIIAHQMRGGHEKRSADYIENDEGVVAQLTHGFHFELLPSRYLTLLSKVAYLHGTSFREVMDLLKQKADGYKGDHVHPRFIACMIRMGDLLDIDSNRFNDFALSKIEEVPESSKAHYDKHQAVKHLLISPEGIEAELDCPTDDSFRVARRVFDWLESEVEQLSRNWNRIVPNDLGGLPPVLHPDSIRILYKGTKTRQELMNLRFDISSKKTFEMLKGGAIYKNPGRVFLREIVQNALDATKLQIWKDMDTHLPFTLQKPDREIDSREKILFSDDIPASIYDKYPINLNVDYDKDRQAIIVTCEDCGTGISEESLIRMTSQVGASRKADEKYNETIAEMPYFLQPTASFGLGLQTVFYVTDEFTVDTHYPGEPTRHIVFRTSTNGSYCSIEEEGFSFQRPVAGINRKRDVAHGTTVTLVVDKEHLRKLFELDEKGVEEFFRAPESIGYHIPEKIDDFARDNFQTIVAVPFHYHSPYFDFENDRAKEGYEFLEESGDFRLYEKRNDNYYKDYSYLIEERKFGSRIQMDFHFSPAPIGYDSSEVSLRSIPTDSIDGWWGPYLDMTWDLCCREADKVANLSRDGLLPEGENWCRKTMDELLPSCIQLIHEHLKASWQKAKEKENKEYLLNQYAHLCLLNWQLPQPLKVDLTPLKKHYLFVGFKTYYVVDNKGNRVDTQRLIESQEMVMVETQERYEFNNIIKKNSKDLKEDEIFIHDAVPIPDAYICTEMFALRDDDNHTHTCYRLRKTDSTSVPQLVSIPNKVLVRREITIASGVALHGFQEYKDIVVSQEAPLLGYYRPIHGNCWIYPLRNLHEVWMEMPKSRNEADKYLLEKDRIKSLVPVHIVKLILKYSEELKKRKESEKEKVEIIYKTYIRLILDHWFGDEDER